MVGRGKKKEKRTRKKCSERRLGCFFWSSDRARCFFGSLGAGVTRDKPHKSWEDLHMGLEPHCKYSQGQWGGGIGLGRIPSPEKLFKTLVGIPKNLL